jgi:hypothetical protein
MIHGYLITTLTALDLIRQVIIIQSILLSLFQEIQENPPVVY